MISQAPGSPVNSEHEAALAAMTDKYNIVDTFRALKLLREDRDREGIAALLPILSEWEELPPVLAIMLLSVLGAAYYGDEQYAESVEWLERGRRLSRDYKIRHFTSETLLMLGLAYDALGRDIDARHAREEWLLFAREVQYTHKCGRAAHLSFSIADNYSRYGDHTEAARIFGMAAEDYARERLPVHRCFALERQGQEKLALNDPEGAASSWRTALAVLDEAADEPGTEAARRSIERRLSDLSGSPENHA